MNTVWSDLGLTEVSVDENAEIIVATTDLRRRHYLMDLVKEGFAVVISDEPAQEDGDPQYGTYTVSLMRMR